MVYTPPSLGDRVALKRRVPYLAIGRQRIDVVDGAVVGVDNEGVRTQLPVGQLATLMLEPGTRISHEAVRVIGKVGCLLVWLGEGGVRLYSSGRTWKTRSDRHIHQANLATDEGERLDVARRMFTVRFNESAPAGRSIEQLRGIEGGRVKAMYKRLAQKYDITWSGRRYDEAVTGTPDLPNRCISAATQCLYAITEAAVLTAGYSPALGFIHHGKQRSFVYDIADLFKFKVAVPIAFKVASEKPRDYERAVRHRCRDWFREHKLPADIIPLMDDLLNMDQKPPELGVEGVHP